jgi:hypothetical protein
MVLTIHPAVIEVLNEEESLYAEAGDGVFGLGRCACS